MSPSGHCAISCTLVWSIDGAVLLTRWAGISSSQLCIKPCLPRAGFHTFDYARHFLSCCSRMLGVEHVTSRGSIMLEYYGRNVGVKIMPTGVQPRRLLDILQSDDCKWRRGELQVRSSHPCSPRCAAKKCAQDFFQIPQSWPQHKRSIDVAL